MSCLGPVTAWRTPAAVRPTPGARVPSLVRASRACCVEKCLRAATRPTGSRARYTLPSSSSPPGVRLVGSRAPAAFASCRRQPMAGGTEDTSLALLVSDVAHAEGRRRLASRAQESVRPNERRPARHDASARRPALAGPSARTCYLVDPASNRERVTRAAGLRPGTLPPRTSRGEGGCREKEPTAPRAPRNTSTTSCPRSGRPAFRSQGSESREPSSFERKLRPKPSGGGHVCLGVTPKDTPNTPPRGEGRGVWPPAPHGEVGRSRGCRRTAPGAARGGRHQVVVLGAASRRGRPFGPKDPSSDRACPRTATPGQSGLPAEFKHINKRRRRTYEDSPSNRRANREHPA
uniref:Uncharacterized protein n=1 Tax=Zea mays TaxID=4577 RepID=A0A804RSH3_MAIZE